MLLKVSAKFVMRAEAGRQEAAQIGGRCQRRHVMVMGGSCISRIGGSGIAGGCIEIRRIEYGQLAVGGSGGGGSCSGR